MRTVGIAGATSFLLFALVTILLALPAQNQIEKVPRGKYLVENMAKCIECHTPRDSDGQLDRNRLLQGAPIPVQAPFPALQWAFQAPDIAGLPGWEESEAVRLLETGRRISGRSPKSPMPNYRMTRTDAEAVVAYLKSLR